MQHVCSGQLPNVGWRAVHEDHLAQHPLFVPLRSGAGKRTRGDVRLFSQSTPEWDSLHHGRLTTSRAAAFLGLCEPVSGKTLGMPGWRRGHDRAISALRHTGGLRHSEEQATIVDSLVFRDRAPPSEAFGDVKDPLDVIRLAGLVPLTPEMVARALAVPASGTAVPGAAAGDGPLWKRSEPYLHGCTPHLCSYQPGLGSSPRHTTEGGASYLRMVWGSVHEATAVLVAMNVLLGKPIPAPAAAARPNGVAGGSVSPVPLLVPSSVVAGAGASKPPKRSGGGAGHVASRVSPAPLTPSVISNEVEATVKPCVLTPSGLAALLQGGGAGSGGDEAAQGGAEPAPSAGPPLPPCLSCNSRMYEVGCCTLEGVFEALAATGAPIPPEYAPAAAAFAHLLKHQRGGGEGGAAGVTPSHHGGAVPGSTWRPVRYPFVGASPDGVIVYGDGRVEAVEVKNHSPFLDGKGWGAGRGSTSEETEPTAPLEEGLEEEGEEGAAAATSSSRAVGGAGMSPHPSSPWLHVSPEGNSPHTLAPHYVPQVQLEIACLGPHCTGCNFVSLAGTGGARVYWVPRDNAYIAAMLKLIGRVYETYSTGKPKGRASGSSGRGRDPGLNYGAGFPEFSGFVARTAEIARKAELRAQIPHAQVQRRPFADPLFFDAPCECHGPA